MKHQNVEIGTNVKNKINVLHLITRMIVGGAQENTMYTAAMLDPNLFDVEILCGPQTGKEGSLIEEARSKGIKLTILPELVRELNPLNDIIALIKIYIYLKKHRFDIVHTHSSKAGILGRIAAKLAGVPVIIHTVHGWSFHDYMSPNLRMIYIQLEKFTAQFTYRLVAVTQKDIEKGLHVGIGVPNQYLLVRSAIPLDNFVPSSQVREEIRLSLGIPQNAKVIGTVSRLSPQKNPLDWVDIASIISNHIPDAYFVFVGDGPLFDSFERKLIEKSLRKNTIMTGLRRDVANLLNCMDVFLLTSLWEGLPRVIPQAMCVGVPVVAYGVDGITEILHTGINGYLVPPHDIKAAANACLELLDSADLHREIARNAHDLATNEFDIRKMIYQLECLYRDSLTDRKAQKKWEV